MFSVNHWGEYSVKVANPILPNINVLTFSLSNWGLTHKNNRIILVLIKARCFLRIKLAIFLIVNLRPFLFVYPDVPFFYVLKKICRKLKISSNFLSSQTQLAEMVVILSQKMVPADNQSRSLP